MEHSSYKLKKIFHLIKSCNLKTLNNVGKNYTSPKNNTPLNTILLNSCLRSEGALYDFLYCEYCSLDMNLVKEKKG